MHDTSLVSFCSKWFNLSIWPSTENLKNAIKISDTCEVFCFVLFFNCNSWKYFAQVLYKTQGLPFCQKDREINSPSCGFPSTLPSLHCSFPTLQAQSQSSVSSWPQSSPMHPLARCWYSLHGTGSTGNTGLGGHLKLLSRRLFLWPLQQLNYLWTLVCHTWKREKLLNHHFWHKRAVWHCCWTEINKGWS